jgi:hypothetical protein
MHPTCFRQLPARVTGPEALCLKPNWLRDMRSSNAETPWSPPHRERHGEWTRITKSCWRWYGHTPYASGKILVSYLESSMGIYRTLGECEDRMMEWSRMEWRHLAHHGSSFKHFSCLPFHPVLHSNTFLAAHFTPCSCALLACWLISQLMMGKSQGFDIASPALGRIDQPTYSTDVILFIVGFGLSLSSSAWPPPYTVAKNIMIHIMSWFH